MYLLILILCPGNDLGSPVCRQQAIGIYDTKKECASERTVLKKTNPYLMICSKKE